MSDFAESAAGEPGGPPKEELTQERDFLLRSLSDLDAELAAGDIDHHDYIELKDGYTARAAAVLRALDGETPSPAAPARPASAVHRRPGRRRRWRAPVVASIVAAFAIAAGLLVANRSGQRLPGHALTGSIAGPAAQLSDALGDLGNGKYLDALKLYEQVIKEDPQNAEALAYRGWILRLTGKAGNDPSLIDRGLQSIRAAEAAEPSYPDAHFFAGEILLRDKRDPAGAVTEFRLVLSNDPPASIVPEVQGELAAAMAASSASGSSASSGSAPSGSAPSTTTGR